MIAAVTITGALEGIGADEDGRNFARVEREAGEVLVSGLTDDEARALAPHFFSMVTVVIGGAA